MIKTALLFLSLSCTAYGQAPFSFDLHSSTGLPQAPMPQVSGSGIPGGAGQRPAIIGRAASTPPPPLLFQ